MPLARRHALVGLVGLVGLVFAAPSLEVHQAYAETRHSLCNAVISEMHIEIHKHSLRKSGEDDIYETVPAICLAIVQNYTLAPVSRRRARTRWTSAPPAWTTTSTPNPTSAPSSTS